MQEFAIIAKHFRPLAQDAEGALNLEDDAALLQLPQGQEFAVTTDAVVAGVHFLESLSPEDIAHKLVGVNLSDLAAMGAMPHGVFLAAQFPKTIDEAWIAAFAQGLGEALAPSGAALLGGDTVSTPGPLALTLTAMGHVGHGLALKRSGAQDGDIVCVSGTIGDAALGLALLQGELDAPSQTAHDHLVHRYARPEPRWKLGAQLSWTRLCSAAVDVSDGLVADTAHIAEASNVAIDLDRDAIPLSPAAQSLLDEKPDLFDRILGGGDDYELVFCVAQEHLDDVLRMASELGERITPIGRVGAQQGTKPGAVRVWDGNGSEITMQTTGYQHF